jgi:hypothetical protein
MPAYKDTADLGRVLADLAKRVFRVENPAPLLGSAWIAPTLLNSWTNFGGGYQTVGYLKDPMGFVHLKGVLLGGSGASNTTVFTLPTGYRPGAHTHGAGGDAGVGGNVVDVQVDTSGNLTIIYGAGANPGISYIAFLAEN